MRSLEGMEPYEFANGTRTSPHPGVTNRLGADEAYVWYAWTDLCCTTARSAYYRRLLDSDELDRLVGCCSDRYLRESLLTRVLSRVTLSRYAEVRPQDWRFEVNAFGRPEILAPRCNPRLRFNLSNARSLVGCVAVSDTDVGLDIEEIHRDVNLRKIADRFFSPRELSALRNLPGHQQRRRFFELWTLKESYIKARGMGLSLPLDQFSFELDAGPEIRIRFESDLQDVPDEWQFLLCAPSEHHLLAVSLRRGNRPDLRIRVAETIPGEHL